MREKPRRRKPTTPGEILRKEFLTPLRMTQRRLADHLGYDVRVVNRIVNGRTSVSAEMALKLGAAFRTTPEFWLNAQKCVDLYRAALLVASLPMPLLRTEDAAGKVRSARRAPRPYDAIREIIGSVKGGPSDLSEATGARFRDLLAGRKAKRS